MPIPTTAEYSVAVLVAAHTTLLALLSGGLLRVRNASDSLLIEISLATPAGTLDGLTGVITLTTVSGTVSVSGTAAYAELCEADGTVVVSMPVTASISTSAGRLALNSLTLLSGATLSLLPSTIG